MKEIEITILMPCLNEEKTVGYCIEEAKGYIASRNLNAEILIVDNGSTDNSVKIARELGVRVEIVNEKGYGNVIRYGIIKSYGRYIIMGDSDMSYDFSKLDDFVEKLREGYHLVVGDRFGNIEKGAMSFSHRYIGIPFLSYIGRKRYGTFVNDFHCGIRGFDRQKAIDVNLKCSGMELATEMIGKFAKNECKVCQVAVALRCDGRGGTSHLRSFRDGMRHLRYMFFGEKI